MRVCVCVCARARVLVLVLVLVLVCVRACVRVCVCERGGRGGARLVSSVVGLLRHDLEQVAVQVQVVSNRERPDDSARHWADPPLDGQALRPRVRVPVRRHLRKREFFIDNLLVRIHFIIVMIRWTGLAPWETKTVSLEGGTSVTQKVYSCHMTGFGKRGSRVAASWSDCSLLCTCECFMEPQTPPPAESGRELVEDLWFRIEGLGSGV